MTARHQKQRELLKRAVESGRVPQAMIFAGGDAEGQKGVALELVRHLNNGLELHRDLILISPEAKEIQIEQIRNLAKELSFTAQFAGFKAVIIDQAHTLNQLAQNCFLKTLEEPPGRVFFILITAYPQMLLPTIRSRCCLLKFSPHEQPAVEGADEIKAVLKEDLAGKFAFAAEQSDTTSIFLLNLVKYLRGSLLQKLQDPAAVEYSFSQLSGAIEQAEELRLLCLLTNVSPRLALESLMLNL